ncbi:MAG: hypothetical protein ACRBBK_00870 [Paracoccaceae bacterium]
MSIRQSATFQERLGRIEKGGANTMGTVYIGSDDDLQKIVRKRAKNGRTRRFSLLISLLTPFTYPLAALLGALAVLIAQFGLHKLQILADMAQNELLNTILHSPALIVGMITLCLIIAYLLRLIFCPNSFLHMGFRLAGMIAMLGMWHNLVHLQPDLFAHAFTQDWISQTTASLPANTFAIQAFVYEL